jgi:hypothetical protein
VDGGRDRRETETLISADEKPGPVDRTDGALWTTISDKRTLSMKREDLTEKILDIKRERRWTWKHITTEIGGVSEVLIVGALLGQMKLVKPAKGRGAVRSLRNRRANAQ